MRSPFIQLVPPHAGTGTPLLLSLHCSLVVLVTQQMCYYLILFERAKSKNTFLNNCMYKSNFIYILNFTICIFAANCLTT